MITAETVALEKTIRRATYKMGTSVVQLRMER